MNHLLKVAHLKTGILALSLLVVVGCSEKPREYAGRYEALSGSECEVVVAGGQVDFEIAILTAGENTGYMLRLTKAVGDMSTKSNPAAPIEDGSITFYFDHLAQRDFGAKPESTMAIGFRPTRMMQG